MDELDIGKAFGLTVKLYALMTPPAVLSSFIFHTEGQTRLQRNEIACKCALAIFLIGEALFLFGAKIFEVFGITLDAFRIGVGLLLFLTAIRLMNEDGSHRHIRKGEDISVVPLALPLGLGPSTIGTLMVWGASSHGLDDFLVGTGCLFMASMGMALLLCLSEQVQKLIGKTGIIVLAKIMALLVAAIAAQVIFTGIKAFIAHH